MPPCNFSRPALPLVSPALRTRLAYTAPSLRLTSSTNYGLITIYSASLSPSHTHRHTDCHTNLPEFQTNPVISAGTYKIPTANDIPVDFRVTLLHNAPNHRTPMVGEGRTPFRLSVSDASCYQSAAGSVKWLQSTLKCCFLMYPVLLASHSMLSACYNGKHLPGV